MDLPLPPDFDDRVLGGLIALEGSPELRQWAWAEVNAFYRRHPEIERTETGTAYVLSILIDAGGRVAESTTATAKKTA